MSKRAFVNDVKIASFTLVGQEPMSSQSVYAKLNFRRYIAARGADVDPRSTRDPNPCPHCHCEVEWAYTFKRDPTHAKGGENYIYARCTQQPKAHRWGFRTTPAESTTTVEQPNPNPTQEEEEMPAPATTKTTTAVAPAVDAFTALIQSVVQATLAPELAAIKEISKTATLDTDAVKTMVAEALAKARTVEITIPSMPKVEFTGKAHPALEKILALIAAGEKFFMVCGPAASGKSTLAKQVAKALKKICTALAINETMTREELLGWRAPNITTGEQKYTPSALVEAWERGDVILIDEVDRGSPNTLCGLNSIEQHVLYVPRSESEGGSESRMGDGAVVICTANTYGTGASRTYVGANQLDAAFLDRFRLIEVGYDRDLEIEITGSPAAVELITEARKRADAASVRRPLTTRMARRAVTDQAIAKGTYTDAYISLCKNAGWTQQEINTVWA